jgi:hypothetical protein
MNISEFLREILFKRVQRQIILFFYSIDTGTNVVILEILPGVLHILRAVVIWFRGILVISNGFLVIID